MIQNTLEKIEERLKKTESMSDENKSELLDLISTLRIEIANLSKTHNEQAESIRDLPKYRLVKPFVRKRTLNLLNFRSRVWKNPWRDSKLLIRHWWELSIESAQCFPI
jgi:hypothetical protein